MTPAFVIAQILSCIVVLMFFFSYQVRSKNILLLLQTTGVVMLCIHYLLLGATAGLALNIVCIARNFIYFFRSKRFFSYDFWPVVLAAIMAVLGGLSWEGYRSLLLIVALFSNTLFLASPNSQLIRASVIGTSSLIFIYNAIALSIGGMINEIVCVSSSIIGIVLYHKREKSARH